MSSERQPDPVDRWLRRELGAGEAAPRRLAAAALEAEPSPGGVGAVTRRAALVTAVLVALLLGGRWLREPGPPPAPAVEAPIRIANFGELVTVVDPAGGVWLHAPANVVAPSSPRMIVSVGGTDAN